MPTKLTELLNGLSMALVMVDYASARPFVEVEGFIVQIATYEDTPPRVAISCEKLLEHGPQLPPEKYGALVQLFLSRAENHLLDRNAPLLFEDEDTLLELIGSTEGADLAEELDASLIVEFIEKHGLLLDELEARVIEYQFESAPPREATEELNSSIKRYIHTLKGDAGSVGLIGIERVCHTLEDLAVRVSFGCMLEELLQFKEWCAAQLTGLIENSPTESSHDFLHRIRSLSPSAHRAEESPQTTGAPSARTDRGNESGLGRHLPDSENSDEMIGTSAIELTSSMALPPSPEPVVNHELLADLLSSQSSTIEPSQAPSSAETPSTGEAPYINLELLAELMNDPSPVLTDGSHSKSRSPEYTISGEPDLVLEFSLEAEDHLTALEEAILDADGVYTKDAVDLIFRAIHSIKGASSYFALLEISESSHLTENLLDEVRTGLREFDPELSELVLNYADLMRNLIKRARASLNAGGVIQRIAETDEYLEALKAYMTGETVPSMSRASHARSESRVHGPDTASPSHMPTQASAQTGAHTPAHVNTPIVAAEGREQGRSSEKLEVKSFVKVETQRLDQLIDTIGEMCIYSSMLIQNTRAHLASNEQIIKITHQVEKFVRDLQNIGMSMRLIPIRGLFQKMSRLVWDTAKKIGKDVRFEMVGEDTELDRTIIEKLADPLMHMVRNAVDHGIEMPEERIRAGKPRTGTIALSAYHAGGSIHVRLEDDGKGLDPQRLITKAIEKGIIPANAQLTREEVFELIFAPGFSTASVVTDISGRGVGMDVVRRNIESMRGRVHIESELGKGTIFTIELPLTLAIMDGIEVSVGPERFIIPTLSVVEFMRPTAEEITRTLDRGETFAFRGRYLPVYRLSHLFDIKTKASCQTDGIFIVVESGGEQATLVVDDIIGSYSTVIKGLGEMFSHVEGVAGCAIVSTGDVSLILDVRSLLTNARRSYSFERVMRSRSGEQEAHLH